MQTLGKTPIDFFVDKWTIQGRAARCKPVTERHILKNIDHLIERQRSGYFVAYHPVTKLKIATYDSWIDAFLAVSALMKAKP